MLWPAATVRQAVSAPFLRRVSVAELPAPSADDTMNTILRAVPDDPCTSAFPSGPDACASQGSEHGAV